MHTIKCIQGIEKPEKRGVDTGMNRTISSSHKIAHVFMLFCKKNLFQHLGQKGGHLRPLLCIVFEFQRLLKIFISWMLTIEKHVYGIF
jgi:hypothetical protein